MLTWYALASGKWSKGKPRTFFEAGGYDGVTGSNTLFLERCLGWKGMLLEGHPSDSAIMLRNRPDNVNVHMAICTSPGFASFVYDGMWNIKGDASQLLKGYQDHFATAYHAKKQKLLTQPVPCMPLQMLFDAQNITHFDVEGAELTALQTIDWSRTTIDILLVELRGSRYGEKSKDVAVRAFLDNAERTGLCRLPASDGWFRDEIWVSRATFGALCDECRRISGHVDPSHLTELPVKWVKNHFQDKCFPKAIAAVDGSAHASWHRWFTQCGHGGSACAPRVL